MSKLNKALAKIFTQGSRPTNAALATFALPTNTALFYQVPDNELWIVPPSGSGTDITGNELTFAIRESFITDGSHTWNNVYNAYQRVTGHALLDTPYGVLNASGGAPNASGRPSNEYLYNIYAYINNGLRDWRSHDWMSANDLFHITRRLITYIQDGQPGTGLGDLNSGRWWLAPQCYVIRYSDRERVLPSRPNLATIDVNLGDPAFITNHLINVAQYGTHMTGDGWLFDNAECTFHWVHHTMYDTQQNVTTMCHWSLIIRHAATNTAHHLDSCLPQKRSAPKTLLLKSALNTWLGNCGKTPVTSLTTVTTVPQQDNEWACSIHTIANAIAFICFGRLGWNDIPMWNDATGPSETLMLDTLRRCIHQLMGLEESKSKKVDARRTFRTADPPKQLIPNPNPQNLPPKVTKPTNPAQPPKPPTGSYCPPGPQGPPGAQGPQGPQGIQGPPGSGVCPCKQPPPTGQTNTSDPKNDKTNNPPPTGSNLKERIQIILGDKTGYQQAQERMDQDKREEELTKREQALQKAQKEFFKLRARHIAAREKNLVEEEQGLKRKFDEYEAIVAKQAELEKQQAAAPKDPKDDGKGNNNGTEPHAKRPKY